MVLENFYTVIQEAENEKRQIRSIRTYQVPLDTRLIQLLPLLGGRFNCEFVTVMSGEELRLSEKKLCHSLLENPMLSMREHFAQKK